jgi:murein DD-endopeptidase MepM/ murein hydrolase activator NlpD
VAPDGRFIIGFGRDAPAHAELVVELPGGVVERHELAIEPRSYEIQRIDGLPSQMVTPDAATLARIRREAEALRAARGADSSEPSFEQRMVWPVTGPISGVYGSQRILDGKPRAPHSGVDIAAPAGAAVGAAAAGIVTFAKDLFLSGGTVVIDHGYGLSTTYAHLATIDVAVGDRVHRGQRIGTVGSGGRATGPHLHWGAGWYQVRLDPALLAGPMPKASAAR